jgi:hypothetical protein
MSKFGKKDECGDDCIYRGLYEGSNASLNDMARSQADALQKNGRLRNAIILLMKRFFPEEFYKAEKNLSSRFLNVDDEIIIAFLTNFIEIMINDDNKSTSIETVVSDLKNYFILNGVIINSNNISDIYQEILGYIKNAPINNDTSEPIINSNYLPTPLDKDKISTEYKSLGELFVNSVMEYKDDEGISPLIPRTIVKNIEEVTDQINVIEPLFPAEEKISKSKSKVKNPQIKAEKPEIIISNYAIDGDKFLKMNDFASSNKPTFIIDLLPIAGNVNDLSTWEKIHRDNIDKSDFRFLASKNRYKQLGSLIINKETVSQSNCWGSCVTELRGAGLYEIGVLLRRINDEVIDYTVDNDIIVIYVNSSRGITKLIVLMSEFDKSNDVKSKVFAQLQETGNINLSLIAILSTKSEKNILTKITESVREFYIKEDLKPITSVVAAHSWEFADDRGSSAKLIIS